MPPPPPPVLFVLAPRGTPPVEEKDQGAAAVGARAKSSRIVLSLIGLCLAMLLVLWMRGGRRAMVSDRPADTPFKQPKNGWLKTESLKTVGSISRNAGTNLRLVGPDLLVRVEQLCFPSHAIPSYRQGVEVQQRQQPPAERYSLLLASHRGVERVSFFFSGRSLFGLGWGYRLRHNKRRSYSRADTT